METTERSKLSNTPEIVQWILMIMVLIYAISQSSIDTWYGIFGST